MYFEHGPGVLGDSFLVISGIGAVGRANIHQDCPALAQHVGDPEASTDFHRLAS